MCTWASIGVMLFGLGTSRCGFIAHVVLAAIVVIMQLMRLFHNIGQIAAYRRSFRSCIGCYDIKCARCISYKSHRIKPCARAAPYVQISPGKKSF